MNKSTHSYPLTSCSRADIGYLVGLFGTVVILVWLGIFKFTPTEAEAIRPLMESHPLMSWLYLVFSVQEVSNLIGIAELVVALGLVLSLSYHRIGFYAGAAASIIFLMTLSFLFTMADAWKWVDGVPIIDFFLFKDLALLSVSLTTMSRCRMS